MRSELQDLVGRRVQRVLVDDSKTVLVFETDQGRLAYRAEGDCCSCSYFEDLLGFGNLLGEVVTEVVDTPADCIPAARSAVHEYDDGYVQFYGHRLSTLKGYVDIVYRNESNGYYGGYLEPTEPPDTRGGGWKEVR